MAYARLTDTVIKQGVVDKNKMRSSLNQKITANNLLQPNLIDSTTMQVRDE